MQKLKSPTERRTKNRFTYYDPAASRVHHLREGLMVKLSAAIDARGWTQSRAAAFFRVTQSRISDLRRARTEKFSLDMLLLWMVSLDQEVQLLVGGEDVMRIDEIAYCTRALELDPKNLSASTRRAYAYQVAGKFDLAEADFTHNLELAPDRPGPRSNRAGLYFAAARYEECVRDCDLLLAAHPDYAGGWELRGQAYEKLGEVVAALADYTRAIEVEPEASAYLYRGRLSGNRADLEKAAALDHQPWAVEQAGRELAGKPE
jgi:tetratricopeptide (TPR) repeat protein